MKLLKEYGSFIDGALVSGPNVFDDINPVTGKVFVTFNGADHSIVDQAVESAQRAFYTWKKTTRGERGQILRAMADRMAENLETLAEVETLETGRTYGESKIHINGAIDCYRYFASARNTSTRSRPRSI